MLDASSRPATNSMVGLAEAVSPRRQRVSRPLRCPRSTVPSSRVRSSQTKPTGPAPRRGAPRAARASAKTSGGAVATPLPFERPGGQDPVESRALPRGELRMSELQPELSLQGQVVVALSSRLLQELVTSKKLTATA